MGRILCIANQKGGVGKTTTAINLAVALAKAGCQTLLADLDPQCNATGGLGIEPVAEHPLLSDQPLSRACRKTVTAGLDVLPGCRSVREADALAASDTKRCERMGQHLAAGMAAYDYVLIDCPPSLGPMTRTALASANEVVMPVQCEYFAMEGLTQMIDLIRSVMEREDSRLQFGGIVLTMYDHTLELTHEVDEQVRDFFGDVVFDTVIPRDVTVSEAPSHGLSVIDYAPRDRGARAYSELCMEVLDRG